MGKKQLLAYLSVRQPLGGQVRDLEFLRTQLVEGSCRRPAAWLAGRPELLPGPIGQRPEAECVKSLARGAQRDAGLSYYEQIIGNLEVPPIIMGHSLGGTMTQVLLDRGYGAAGVGIASATVKGVRDLPWSTIKSTFAALNPLKKGQAVPLTEREFHYAFGNTLSLEESNEIYRRYHVPAATQVLRDVAFSNLHRHPSAAVDFRREGRVPLLLVAFGEDHVVPPKASGTTRRSTTTQCRSRSTGSFRDVHIFPARLAGKKWPTTP
jgi:hypothetical protein